LNVVCAFALRKRSPLSEWTYLSTTTQSLSLRQMRPRRASEPVFKLSKDWVAGAHCAAEAPGDWGISGQFRGLPLSRCAPATRTIDDNYNFQTRSQEGITRES